MGLHVAAAHADGIEAMRMYLLHSHGAGAATTADEAAVWPATRPPETTACSSYHSRPTAADAHSHSGSADPSASSSASQTTADT